MLFKVIQISLICLLVLQNKAFGDDEVRELPGPMEPGVSVLIHGAYHYWGTTFEVNLQTNKNWPDADIYFHMSVRYNKYEDKIVLNTWKKGGEGEKGYWEKEELYNGVPDGYGTFLKTGMAMRIIAKEDHFQVYINGKQMALEYRMEKEKLKDIKYLTIKGAYTVSSIKWEREIGDKKYQPY